MSQCYRINKNIAKKGLRTHPHAQALRCVPHNTGRCICSHMHCFWHIFRRSGHGQDHTHRLQSRARHRKEASQYTSPDRGRHRAHSGCWGGNSGLQGGLEIEVSEQRGNIGLQLCVGSKTFMHRNSFFRFVWKGAERHLTIGDEWTYYFYTDWFSFKAKWTIYQYTY